MSEKDFDGSMTIDDLVDEMYARNMGEGHSLPMKLTLDTQKVYLTISIDKIVDITSDDAA